MDLDKQIQQIQRSTRTLFKLFLPLHDWLRLHFLRYYTWSQKSYSHAVHWIMLIVFVLFYPLLFLPIYQSPPQLKAETPAITYDFPRWEWANPKPTGAILLGVDAYEEGSVWAVGQVGTILKYSGGEWKSQFSGTDEDLQAVYGLDSSNAWAVGRNGTILKYNGISSGLSRRVG